MNAEIAEPVAVRYGWGDNPAATLRNQADLPAAPFRTDDWATSSVTATAK
jgi:sialate O-acetylesterase